MNVYEIVGSILLIITSILTVVAVLLQSSKNGGVSALGGGESFLGKSEGRTIDAKLCRATKVLAIVLFVVTIATYAVSIYVK